MQSNLSLKHGLLQKQWVRLKYELSLVLQQQDIVSFYGPKSVTTYDIANFYDGSVDTCDEQQDKMILHFKNLKENIL